VTDVADAVRHFIVREYLPGESPANLLNDMPLLSTGILDSLATLGVISFLQREYHITIDAYETDVDNFDRIVDIVALVERKRARLAARV
jgi:acyl carrier protein